MLLVRSASLGTGTEAVENSKSWPANIYMSGSVRALCYELCFFCYQQMVKFLSSVKLFLISVRIIRIILLKCMSPNVFIYFAGKWRQPTATILFILCCRCITFQKMELFNQLFLKDIEFLSLKNSL